MDCGARRARGAQNEASSLRFLGRLYTTAQATLRPFLTWRTSQYRHQLWSANRAGSVSAGILADTGVTPEESPTVLTPQLRRP